MKGKLPLLFKVHGIDISNKKVRNSSLSLILLFSLIIGNNSAFAADPALVQSGYNYMKKGYIKDALPAFQRAVKMYPENLQANLGLALAAIKQGGEANQKIAVTHLRKVLKIQPNNVTALKNLARILSWNPATRDEAISYYEKAISLNPNDQESLVQYAEVLIWAQESNRAIPIFEKVYRSNQNSPKVVLNYANALSSAGQYSESLPIYNRAKNLRATFDNYSFLNYAKALSNTGNKDVAQQIYQNLLRGAKTKVELNNVKKELASSYFEQGLYSQALALDSTIEPKDKTVLLRIARAQGELGDRTEALKTFETIYNLYPEDNEVKRGAAQFLASIGGYNINASKLYEDLITSGSATVSDRINLAYLYNSTPENKNKAIQIFQSLLNDDRVSPSQKTDIRLALARSLGTIETYRPQAVTLYREMLATNPENMNLRLEYLELLSWQNETRPEAINQYLKLLELNPGDSRIQKGLDQTLGWYSPTEKDLPLYENLLKRYPDNPNIVKGFAQLVSSNPNMQTQALDMYNRLLAADPNNTGLQLETANLLAKNKDTRKQALELYRNIYTQQPDNMNVAIAYANNLLYEHKYKDAKEIYDRILSVSVDNKEALLGKARVYSWQGLDLSAYKAYSAAYERYPDDADIAYEFANVAKKLGQNAKALEIIQKMSTQSYLPDAPAVATELAMANCYEAIHLEDNQNLRPGANVDIIKLQKDLDEIKRGLAKIQEGIKSIEEDDISTTASITKIAMPVERLNTKRNVILNTKNLKDSGGLPEPVAPGMRYTGTVSYAGRSIIERNDILNTSRSGNDAALMREIVFANDLESQNEEDMANSLYINTFDNLLSGRRAWIFQNQFSSVEQDVMYSMRPEVRTGFFLANYSGHPTASGMEVHGYPTMVSVNLTPQNRARFGISSYTFGMSPQFNPASITMTTYTLGLNSRPHQRLWLDGEVSINGFSDPNAPVDVTGNASMAVKLHDRATFNVGFRREPLYQSVFETTGYTLQPQYNIAQFTQLMGLTSGPLYNPDNTLNYNLLMANPQHYHNLRGPFMGMVRDNAITAMLSVSPFNKWDVNAGYEFSAVRGRNIAHNHRHQAMFSFGRTFTGVKDHLFRLGYQFVYFGYKRNLSAFPSMTPYAYTENGQYIPVDRQLSYEETLAMVNNKWVQPGDILNWANAQLINPNAPLIVTGYQSPVDLIRSPRGVGIGGYFSPSHFFLNSFRLDLEGKLFNGRISYKGGGSLGVQTFGNDITRDDVLASRGLLGFRDIPAGDPRRNNAAFNTLANIADTTSYKKNTTSLASAFDFTVFLKLTDFLSLYSGVDYLKTGGYNRWSYTGGLLLRPAIKALTPVFRKPGNGNGNCPAPAIPPATGEETGSGPSDALPVAPEIDNQ